MRLKMKPEEKCVRAEGVSDSTLRNMEWMRMPRMR